ncbi:EF-hand domain-containing protein [Oleiharenicola lentus]|uniref:EF-hand domain-containing protein n=1 Tax=Oleiharenicola lentus TaxID=2508720 RepID=UPI003F674E0C
MKTKSLTLLSAGVLALALSTSLHAGEHHGDEFKAMDTNSDGKVSREEHLTFSRSIGKLADGNSDGYVTAAEWDAAAAKSMPGEKMDPAHTAAQLRMMDTDGDGKVSNSESDAFAASIFSKSDTDSDGLLSKSEFKAAQKELKKATKEQSGN